MFAGYSENFWINLLGFNLVWWISILLGDGAVVYVCLLMVVHLLLHRSPMLELQTMMFCGLVGFTVDLVLTLSGVFLFGPGSPLPPLWLALLWLAFAATLRQSLGWFRYKYFISTFCGALAGASTYLAAEKLEAVTFGIPQLQTAVLIAAIWAVLFPMLMAICNRLEEHYAELAS